MTNFIGQAAPAFTAQAVMADGTTKSVSLSDYAGKYVALFFYPKDFTFVCPSELIAFDHRIAEFEKRDVQVLGVSMDDAETHARWRDTAINDGGVGPLKYPLIADTDKVLSNAYDVVHAESGFSARGTFLIDPDGVCWHAVVNNLPLGRDVDELLRAVDGVQFFKEHGEVCPAGWSAGKAGMAPSDEGVKSYLTDHASKL